MTPCHSGSVAWGLQRSASYHRMTRYTRPQNRWPSGLRATPEMKNDKVHFNAWVTVSRHLTKDSARQLFISALHKARRITPGNRQFFSFISCVDHMTISSQYHFGRLGSADMFTLIHTVIIFKPVRLNLRHSPHTIGSYIGSVLCWVLLGTA